MNYYIVTEGRTGSTLLCDYLKQIGAGSPDAIFNKRFDNIEAYRAYLDNEKVGNAVGAKVSWDALQYHCEDAFKFLTKVLPDPKWIHLTRRNRVMQALSREKHLRLDSQHVHDPVEMEKYRAADAELAAQEVPEDAIWDRIHLNSIENIAWLRFFDKYGITPLTIEFEDFIADKTGTLATICRFLGIRAKSRNITDNILRTFTNTNKEWYNSVMASYTKLF